MPVDFRKQILDRLHELGRSKYWLSERLAGGPSRNTLYSYLRSDTDMAGENIAKVLDALEVEPSLPMKANSVLKELSTSADVLLGMARRPLVEMSRAHVKVEIEKLYAIVQRVTHSSV